MRYFGSAMVKEKRAATCARNQNPPQPDHLQQCVFWSQAWQRQKQKPAQKDMISKLAVHL